MSAISTNTNRQFIEAEIQSSLILRAYPDFFLPEVLWRNIAEFAHGDSYKIPTVGKIELQEVSEGAPIEYQPISTGSVMLYMTDEKGDGWAITDNMREDGTNIDGLLAARADESSQAYAKDAESRSYEVLNAAQAPNNGNAINNINHRFVASGTNATITQADIIQVRRAFDTANVPEMGRVGIITSTAEATLSLLYTNSYNVDSNNVFQNVLESGFAQNHRLVMTMMGITLMVSNLLPGGITETIDTVAVGNGEANIFMSLASDDTKPLMFHQRRVPSVEGERNKDLRQDEYTSSTRYALGVQRTDGLVIVLTDALKTS